MKNTSQGRLAAMILSLFAAAAVGCSSEAPGDLGKDGTGDLPTPGSDGTTDAEEGPEIGVKTEDTVLKDRVIDYNEALRTASLKLVGALPTLEQIKAVARSQDQKLAYESAIDAMLDDVRFQERMIKWWKDVMRQGGGAQNGAPNRNTAPIFAARVLAEGRPYSDLFTATSGNCPTYDSDAHAFVDGDCDNGVPAHAGVLTNPGVMYQFYGNMAFRRVRWVQEIFVCTKFPAEYSDAPIEKNGAEYISPWEFESVASAPVDFQDTKSVICANCHTTINHVAPLFANFDANGMWKDTIQVMTPQAPDAVPTELSHWLKDGETTAWRLGEPAADLPSLGQAIAADPAVHECAVARLWNYAMSKEDIVSDLATVPTKVLSPYLEAFADSGQNMKETLRVMLKSDDFIRF